MNTFCREWNNINLGMMMKNMIDSIVTLMTFRRIMIINNIQ